MASDSDTPKPAQYRAVLDPERFGVLFEENTERPFTGLALRFIPDGEPLPGLR